jgi:two-component system, LytTR family, sensor kinase
MHFHNIVACGGPHLVISSAPPRIPHAGNPSLIRLFQRLNHWLNSVPFLWRFQLIFWSIYGVASFPIHFAGLKYAAGWSASFTAILCFKIIDYVYGIIVTTSLGLLYGTSSFRSLRTGEKIVLVCLASASWVALDRLVIGPVLISPFGRTLGEFHRPPGDRLLLRFIVTLWMFLLYAGWSAIFLLARSAVMAAKNRERLREEEIRRQTAELGLLRTQMNPHFLFNAMNTISSEADGNVKIDRLVGGLSDYLRYSLASAGRSLVTLAEELHATRQYLEVEKARFGTSLEVTIDTDPAADALMVPGILLQPLVENAIKHGRETSLCPLRIRIHTAYHLNELVLTVANTGRWAAAERPTDAPSGLGLTNIQQRLAILYPGRSSFTVDTSDDEVLVTIRITDPGLPPPVHH